MTILTFESKFAAKIVCPKGLFLQIQSQIMPDFYLMAF